MDAGKADGSEFRIYTTGSNNTTGHYHVIVKKHLPTHCLRPRKPGWRILI